MRQRRAGPSHMGVSYLLAALTCFLPALSSVAQNSATGLPTPRVPANYVVDESEFEPSDTFYVEAGSQLGFTSRFPDKAYTKDVGVRNRLNQASGGTPPYTYSLTPSPPDGLTVSEDNLGRNLITGTPTTPQAAVEYTWQVQDAAGATASLIFDITVNTSLRLDGNFTYSYNVLGSPMVDITFDDAVGGTPPYTYSLTGDPHMSSPRTAPSGLPPGMLFDDVTRTLSGIPTSVPNGSTYGMCTDMFYLYKVVDANNEEVWSHLIIELDDDMTISGTVSDQAYTVNQQITPVQLPSVTGGCPSFSYDLSPSLPSGLSFDAATRTISGTPTAELASTTYTFEVTDRNGLTASTTFQLTVNSAVALSGTVSDLAYTQNHLITNVILPAATGGTAPITYSLSPSLPSGLSFDSTTRTLSGTPTAVRATEAYTYEAKDANGATATKSFNLTVNGSLALGKPANQTYALNQKIPDVILPAATGGTAPFQYSLSPGLPTGLSFNSITRTISGTPMVVQAPTTYTYYVKDANAATASVTFDLSVSSGLALDPIPDQFYTQYQKISDLILPTATGGTPPYIYAYHWPAKSNGLSFDFNSRTLSGTPTSAHTALTYTWEVEDADGTTVSSSFSVTVKSTLVLPATIAPQVYAQHQPITPLTLPEATGGSVPYTYSISPKEPTGLTFDQTTRRLSGTPTRIQAPIPYTYRVEDADGTIRTATFTIEVKAPLALPGIANQVYTRNLQITDLALPAAIGGTLPYTYTLKPNTLPSGLTYDPSTRTLSGTPTVAQPAAPYTYQVKDRLGATKAQAFTIAVVDSSVLVLPAVPDQVYVFGEAVSFDLAAARGGVLPHQYSLSPIELPQGLSYDNTRLRISGTAEAAMAPREYTFTVSDAAQQSVSHTFSMEVLMTLAPIEDQQYVVGQAIADLELPASGGGTDPHVFALSPELPDGLVFDPVTRAIAGTPLAGIPRTPYTYTVTDVFGVEASQTFDIEVRLALASIEHQSFVVGEAIPSTILPAAEGGQDPHIYTLTPEPPSGLGFNAATRTLSGTPQEQMSSSVYRYHVSDSNGAEADRTFTLEVVAAVLQLPAVADQHFVVGSEIVPVELPAATGGLGPHRYNLSPSLPPGLVFDAATRKLGGTPTAASALAAYTYTVEDAGGNTSSQTFGIQVHSALALPQIADQQFAVGRPIAPVELPAATGGLGPYRYSLTPDLVQGLSFNATTRTLSGTPALVSAPRAYTYTAVDSMGHAARQTFEIAVYGKLSIFSIENLVYTVGKPVADLILPEATGGVEPYTYNLSPQAPAGLTFDTATRTLSGTPISPMAQTNYTYTAKDAVGSTGSQDFGITILVQALTIAPVENQIYQVGEQITPLELPAARGGRPPYEYVLSPDPPQGLTFDAEQRVLSGTPASVLEQAKYAYEVIDSDGTTATQEFTIIVGTSAALLGDRAALIALYRSTDGPNWTNSTNWLNPPEEVVIFTAQQLDAWYGVNVSQGRVSSVELPVNNLQGILPSELGNLTALEQLELPNNGLQGEIPFALEKMRSLRHLHLQKNQLSGTVPEALGNLSALRQLWLFGNSLSGTIPSTLSSCTHLQGLLLSDNEFTGTIPEGLAGLVGLQDLWLQGNSLSGTIPSELGKLDSLRTLFLNDNEFSGEIPPVLGNLLQLRDLWLHRNDLTGSIPSELGSLDSLRGLLLDNNRLTGTIPPALGDLPNLQWLQLQENALSGEIPMSLGRLAQLERLQLSGNSLTGQLPESLGKLTALEHLYVHENAMSGPLPATLIDLGALKELFFDGPIQELCAPTDTEFNTWLSTLVAVRGPECGASTLSFAAPVLAKSFLKGKGANMVLPAAEGGQAPYKYTLHPEPPAGLIFDAEQRTLAGTPTDTVANMEYTYAAVDNMGRKGKVNFTITVLPIATTLLEVHGNYPNPFRESTNLNISLASDADISVEVFDLLGRRVLKKESLQMQAGGYQPWPINGLTAGSGIYLYRVRAATLQETQVRTGRMTVIK